ncbi:MAG: hypothetical protein GC168_04090 [Candidatus Hydrogenedens sp.]|nr:hypothetical protein [Candidatus Hydrogenedens sp.]
MTKIYEALESAGQGRQGAGLGAGGGIGGAARMPKPLENKLLGVARRVAPLAAERGGAAVQFVSAQGGDDSSRIAVAFSKLVPTRLGKQTLLLAAGPRPASGKMLPASGAKGWDSILTGDASLDDTLYKTDVPGLTVAQVSGNAGSLPTVLASPKAAEIMDSLRSRFQMIVVDAPPAGASWDAVVLANLVDGAVIVVEAGRTRWQAVQAAVDNIEGQNGQVFGVILNKQKHYIPQWVYRLI